MGFITHLLALDTQLFLFINGLHNSFFDVIMWAMSDKLIWLPLYANVVFILIRIWRKDAVWAILALIVCIVLCDQIASGILKTWVQRPRPTHATDLTGMIHTLHGYVGGKYGFVSSHASNSFGFALLTALIFRNKGYSITIILWASIIAYSRIYLGVHYPLDILGGALVGIGSAYFCYLLLKKYRPSFFAIEGIIALKNDKKALRIITIITLVSSLIVLLVNV
jgi:undecaprenyl-diphosphatase